MYQIAIFLGIIIGLSGCGAPSSATQASINTSLDKNVIAQQIKPDTSPPVQIPYVYDTSQWTELKRLDTTIQILMKYSTIDNFVKEAMYPCSRCFLRPEVAKQIIKIQKELKSKGYGLKMLDCYRPKPIQQKLWDKVPDARYVTPPQKGSMHNRGQAVDLTLVDQNGRELDMGTPYDFFGEEAYPGYTNLPDSILSKRRLLSAIMTQYGFRAIRTEWWHFSYKHTPYPISSMVWECE